MIKYLGAGIQSNQGDMSESIRVLQVTNQRHQLTGTSCGHTKGRSGRACTITCFRTQMAYVTSAPNPLAKTDHMAPPDGRGRTLTFPHAQEARRAGRCPPQVGSGCSGQLPSSFPLLISQSGKLSLWRDGGPGPHHEKGRHQDENAPFSLHGSPPSCSLT